MLGDLACRLPFRRASGHRISASHAGRTDGRRRVDRKGSKTVNLQLIIFPADGVFDPQLSKLNFSRLPDMDGMYSCCRAERPHAKKPAASSLSEVP
jgi:hypothetical protein